MHDSTTPGSISNTPTSVRAARCQRILAVDLGRHGKGVSPHLPCRVRLVSVFGCLDRFA